MKDLRKVVPPKREILRGIWLSFFPGAKIGVLGANGAGKSHAAPDHGRRRQRLPRRGVRRPTACASATSRRSRSSIQRRTCAATSRRGSPRRARCSPASRRSARSSARRSTADEMEKLLDEQARLQDAIDARQRLGPRPHRRDRDGRAAGAAGRRRRRQALRRRAAPRGAVPAAAVASPTCCCSTSRPTTSTPSRWRGSSAILKEYPGTVVAITHDRYFLDNVAGWILELDRGHGIPWEGNYTSWLEQKSKRLARRGESRPRAPAHAGARARVGADGAARAAGQEQGAPAGRTSAARRVVRDASGRGSRSPSRRGRGSATSWSRPTTCARLRRPRC